MKNREIKVIILEDEPAHAEAIKKQLIDTSSNGCNITIATSLREFDEITSYIQPDLVIADMNLPDGNALSLLNGQVDSQPWPILVMTSYGDEELAVKALKSGALDYIVKSPETFKNIRRVVDRNIREWRNIKKSKLAEIALIENEKKFRTLFVTMEQGVIYWDANGIVTEANPAAEKILGLSLAKMLNRKASDYRWGAIHEDGTLFNDDDYPVTQAIQSANLIKDVSMGLYNTEKEEYRWIIISASPQFLENETRPFQVFTTFTDITELKQVQDKLQLQNLELKAAKEKAEESDKLKSAFMANMSHEIRTPMNGILGFADLLKNPNLSGETKKKYIDVIEISGHRMLEIINDLIDISKIESGQVEVKKEIFKIGNLLEELLMFFFPEANIKEIQLSKNLQLPSNNFLVETDKTKLAQVITNLIKNALKFTKTNGKIELGCKLQEENILFYVKDTGKGIRKELQDKVFDRFRQGEMPQDEIHEGVGLGLSISKAFVEMLGGKIGIESTPGQGSVFSFTIPYNSKINIPLMEDDKPKITSTSHSGLNVLIAEDDEPSYMLLHEILRKNNISSVHVKNGKEAVSILQNNHDIDLVLMDLKMPVMDGFQATELIKKSGSEVPIIAQSAFVSEADIQHAIEAGCSDYIIKPIKITELLTKIAAFCNIKKD